MSLSLSRGSDRVAATKLGEGSAIRVRDRDIRGRDMN